MTRRRSSCPGRSRCVGNARSSSRNEERGDEVNGMARKEKFDGIDGLLEKGRAQGFVTYDELNSVLPPDILTGDQIDDVMEIFGENAIEVVDAFQKVPVAGRNLLIGEEEAAEEEAAEEEEAAVEE